MASKKVEEYFKSDGDQKVDNGSLRIEEALGRGAV